MKRDIYKNYTIFDFHELASTNDEAKKMAIAGQSKDGDVIICNIQTDGRGRMDRKWTSEGNNLHFSLILQPKIDLKLIHQLTFIAINSLKEAVFELFQEKNPENIPKINKKWPNDLLIDDKKVAGILIESLISDNKCDFLIVGIGVNIDSNPDNTLFPASNLVNFDLKTDKSEVLQQFLDKFTDNYQNWSDFGFEFVKNKWLNDAWKINEEVSINSGSQKNTGIFIDIGDNGDILLHKDNEKITISVGDVF